MSVASSRPNFGSPDSLITLLRTDESYTEKWNYVRNNPVRAGLAKNAGDWPYQGEIVLIDRA